MEGCIHMPVPDDQLHSLITSARNYALSHGIIMKRSVDAETHDVVHAPFMLFPTPVPRASYQQARAVQTDFNLLMHKVAHDYDFMKEALKEAVQVDDFTRRLWNIYEAVRKEGKSQPISLGLIRSDYMMHTKDRTSSSKSGENIVLKQIEINMIASSFGGICSQLLHCHRYVLGKHGKSDYQSHLPENNVVRGFAGGMVSAWQEYGKPGAAILFLVSDVEKNIYDQLFLEYGIADINPNIRVIRATLLDVYEKSHLTEDNVIILDGIEIAVVYYRSGYTDSDYAIDLEKTWSARLNLERSQAIKCPSVQYQLVGTKKIQQVLATPAAVERFISIPAAVRRVRATFAGQYSLDQGKEGDEAVAMAIGNPEKYVMKPQREGGGNNIYDEDVRTTLLNMKNSDERSAYILMERIHPAPIHNYAVRAGQPVQLHQMISELGIYGVVLGSADGILKNEQVGHNLRTKTEGMNEGGVMVGFSCLDTPYLI